MFFVWNSKPLFWGRDKSGEWQFRHVSMGMGQVSQNWREMFRCKLDGPGVLGFLLKVVLNPFQSNVPSVPSVPSYENLWQEPW